eukprot:jgi/Hompol1/6103/HPOL_002170-RA
MPGAAPLKTQIPLDIQINSHSPSAYYLPHVRTIPIPAVKPDDAIHFGDHVTLNLKGMSVTFDMWSKTFVPTTCSSIHAKRDERECRNGTHEFEMFVTCGPVLARQVFEITRCQGERYPDDIIRQDTKFKLVTPKGAFDTQYAIRVAPVNIANLAHSEYKAVILSPEIDSYQCVW